MRYPFNIRPQFVPRIAARIMIQIIAVLLAIAMGHSSSARAQAVLTNTNLPGAGFQLSVNTDGSYALAVGNGTGYTPWLVSGETGVAVGQQWYSSPNARGLLLTSPTTTTSSGTDPKLGDYNAITQSWLAGTTPYVTEFRVFVSSPSIVFEQRFPNGVGTSGYPNGVSSSFPSFTTGGAKAPALRFLTFNDGFAAPQRGTGLGNIPSVNGAYGPDSYSLQGGLPLALIDDSVATLPTVVLSPLNNFKSGVQTLQNQLGPQTGTELACGIQGQVQTIPAGFVHDTVLYAGAGVNNTFSLWGSTLMGYYGKDRSGTAQDFTNNYLGYWTDRGSYYYYSYLNAQNAAVSTTDSTLLGIQADQLNRKLPFRYYQFDSWWYYKSSGDSGGTTQWDGQTASIRPTGEERFPSTGSMAALNAKMTAKAGRTVPFQQHNRFWNASNVYTPTYNFLIDSANGASCPDDPLFWPFLINKAALNNNETTLDANGIAQNDGYEQDWLQYELLKCTPLQKDVSSARNWLTSMGAAAANKGIKVQYCQALGSDYLESLEIPAVTQIRSSGDYGYDGNNWRIGTTSMLAWAVGLAPFKDTFWTTTTQPGSHNVIDNAGYTEANPSLQALVATLSGGPVGPGDGIGYTDPNLLMKTCRTDGLLLKPDKPATAIDRTYTTAGVPGEVWSAYSDTAAGRCYYVESLGLSSAFSLAASDLGLSGSAVAYDTRSGNLAPFDAGHPLSLAATGAYNYNYDVIAPLGANGWALLGETPKFVTVSKQRFNSVSVDGMTTTVQGPGGEVVSLNWYGPAAPAGVAADGAALTQGTDWSYNNASHLLSVNRTIPAGGSTTLHVITNGPAAPTNLIATPGNGLVNLSWTASPGVSSYNVKRSMVSGGPYTTIGATAASSTVLTDAQVANGSTYYYVVTALNTGIEGSNSNEANATPYPNPVTMNLVPDTTSTSPERMEDIEDQIFKGFLSGGGQVFSYGTTAQATLTYDQAPPGGCFVGHVEARGLKPNFAYQIKLSGVPDLANPSDVTNQTNTNLGYAGRWFSDVLNNNADDRYVAAHPAEPVRGYLQMGCFVTNASGSVSWSFVGDHSNHVDWRLYNGTTQSGTVTTSDVSNTGRYMLANTRPMPWFIFGALLPGSSTTYYAYGSAPASMPATLYYEHQIDSAGGTRADPVCLPSGSYLCNFVLTEESFHANTGTTDPNGGYWKTVLESHDSPNTNPNISFTIGVAAISPSIGAASASVSVVGSGGTQYTAVAKVTVMDNGTQVTGPANGNGEFIGGATVTGQWSWTDPTGAAQTTTVTGPPTTSDGVVNLSASISAKAGSTVSFTVMGIMRANWVTSKPGYVWDQMPTAGAASVPASSAPSAPTNLVATGTGGTASLSWSSSTGAATYNLRRSTVNGSGYQSFTTSTGVSSTGISATSFTDTGLTPGSIYYYVVQAVNGGGTSANSNQASITFAPAAPTLSASAGNGTVSLSWTTAGGAISYALLRSTTSNSGYLPVANASNLTGTSFTDTGLANGTTYYYIVRASNSGGTSANSKQASASPSVGLTITAGPTATPSRTSARISWTTNLAASSVVHYGTTMSLGKTVTGASGVTSHGVTLGSLVRHTTYYYSVQSTAGSSTVTSTIKSFTTN